MSSTQSCKQCGCSDIDTDPARGDAVCTNCGCVIEESIIVSEVTFEENGHGGASAIGQFVSADSRGGGGLSMSLSGVGGAGGFHVSVGKESREITLRNAKRRINEVAQQLRLNQHCIDVAFNFFKMALHKQLTKGRKNSLTIAACIYMTCRIEGTPHLLIDFSDVLQMDVYALGRAYVQISRSLYINIPAMDPCMYMLRFAHKFDLGDRTHDVAMTALRLVQRMKRDWIHLGRRPSGLCGAALLISARLHNFSRSVQDVISVVKVHETTLRKRLVEFGETPSSSLTLDEFMSVDLEEEHDPPSYKAARIKDRERLQKLLDAEIVSEEFKSLQQKIEDELEKRRKKLMRSGSASPAIMNVPREEEPLPIKEKEVQSQFIIESTIETIHSLMSDDPGGDGEKLPHKDNVDRILMPPPPRIINTAAVTAELQDKLQLDPNSSTSSSLALVPVNRNDKADDNYGELELEGIDDNEINGYIMTNVEVQKKTQLWETLNKDYLESQKLKQEQIERDIKEGKFDKKKKKKPTKAKPTFQAKSANEAIKIMLTERKMSSKINYDVLRSLTSGVDSDEPLISSAHNTDADNNPTTTPELVTVIESGPIIPANGKRKVKEEQNQAPSNSNKKSRRNRKRSMTSSSSISESEDQQEELRKPKIEDVKKETKSKQSNQEMESKKDDLLKNKLDIVPVTEKVKHTDEDEDPDDEEPEEPQDESSLSAKHLLRKFRGGEDEDDEYYE